MFSHTSEDPEINQTWMQNQAKQDDRPNEAQQKGPIQGIQTTMRAQLFLWAHLGVYPHVLFFLPINTLLLSLLSVSVWKFISIHLMGQGLITGHWSLVPGGLVARIQPSVISGQEPKSCSKPLQAEGTRDQPLSHSHKNYFEGGWQRHHTAVFRGVIITRWGRVSLQTHTSSGLAWQQRNGNLGPDLHARSRMEASLKPSLATIPLWMWELHLQSNLINSVQPRLDVQL